MITNPAYGGAYAYGKTGVAAQYDGTGAKDAPRRKPRGEWLALQPGAHEGYVDWDRAEAIRTMVSDNVPTSRHHGAPKHGDALLAGLLRCRRCGRKLTVQYTGAKHNIPRYACLRGPARLWRAALHRLRRPAGRRRHRGRAAPVRRARRDRGGATAEAEAARARDQAREAMLRDLEAALRRRPRLPAIRRRRSREPPRGRRAGGALEPGALARRRGRGEAIAEHDAAAPRP